MSEPLLLMLDYPGYRPEARIGELGLEQHGLRVRNLLAGPLPRTTGAAAYVAQALATGHPDDRPVTAVGAYCVSGSLAFEAAARVAAAQGHRPVIVLFDAEDATAATILASYREALSRLGVRPSEADLAARVDLSLLTRDPEALVEALSADLAREAVAALAALGGDGTEARESARHLSGAYADWLRHILAAHDGAGPSWEGEVLRITSADTPAAPFTCRAAAVREVRVSCARPDLLRSEETRVAVLAAVSDRAGVFSAGR
ncbi:hypothetical protein GCM10018793_69600 [Streptomyces sulfonofaciens]|uniref:Uncharacterized protein n=1 Tax=Streptomyces sulfonofaciens TaxID=68272 RepID=A0A919GR63_9ACTN|nr:hypothetical protein [Streptomyces sulfonofaciens]GHH88743.1 hypothetical protein GCM10018793_69600 [Streptomyces sulfonofaciens]